MQPLALARHLGAPTRFRLPRLAIVGTVLIVLTALGVATASAAASTLYVDRGNPACSDQGQGTQAQPYCTIGKAASVIGPGQTVLVSSGTYSEAVVISGKNASASSPIVVRAADGASVTVRDKTNGFSISSSGYVTVQGFTVTATSAVGIYATGSNHITIAGNHVSYAGHPVSGQVAQGIRLNGTNDSLVRGNTTDHNSEAGIQLVGGSTRNTVQGNESFANARGYTRAAPGIDLRAPGNTVIGNSSHDNEDSGIQSYGGGSNGLIVNNVAYYNGDHGIDDLNVPGQRIIGNSVWWNFTAGINVEGTSSGATVENNVSVDNGYGISPCITGPCSPRTHGDIRIDPDSTSGTTVDYNLTWLNNPPSPATLYVWGSSSYTSLAAFRNATGQGAHDLQADPKWVSTSGHDYHLTAGSPAIDSANSGVSGQQTTDFDGNGRVDDPATPNVNGAGPRPYDDRGAFEFQPGGPPPPDNPPAAALGVTPSSGAAPLSVTADASASTDTDATPIASYTFDFGDGTVVGPQPGATATHTYTASGTYTVKVTVTDTANQAGTATAGVTVSSAQDSPPSAALAVTPSSGAAPLGVTADASASTDTDATPIASYTFDFGDGTVVGPQAGATATHTYTASGTYTVKVTVTDTASQAGSATASVNVSGGGGGGGNLVANSGFESNTTGWNGTPTLAQVAGGHSGSFAAKLSNTTTSSTSCTLNDSPNWVTTTTGGTYTGSIWVRADTAGASIRLRFREYNGSVLVSSATTTATLSTSWQQVTVTYTPGAAGSSTLDFNAYISSAPPGTCFYADDAAITLG